MVTTELQRWSVYNAKNGQFADLTDGEFNKLIQNGGLKLTGNFISIFHPYTNIESKVWADAMLNSEYFK